jgi:hypothetical protein
MITLNSSQFFQFGKDNPFSFKMLTLNHFLCRQALLNSVVDLVNLVGLGINHRKIGKAHLWVSVKEFPETIRSQGL